MISPIKIFTLYELLNLTLEELTLDDMRRISTASLQYYRKKYKTPPTCPSCGNLLKAGPGFFPCDTVATCNACHWTRDNQKLVTLIEYSNMEGAAA